MTIRIATAEVVRGVDGDTVHTNLDIGWGIVLRPRIGKEYNFGTLRICLPDGSSYDAPETGTSLGKEAAAFASTLWRPGDKLPVVSHGIASDGRRTLASVTLANGRDWAEVMAENGFLKGRT